MFKKIPVQIGDIVWVHIYVGTSNTAIRKNGYVTKICYNANNQIIDYDVELFVPPTEKGWRNVVCYWSGYDYNWGLVK